MTFWNGLRAMLGVVGKSSNEPCRACVVYQDQVTFLKAQLMNVTREKENERNEYKRAIDALLLREKLPAIGQGYSEAPGVMDTAKLLSFLEEETKDIGKDGSR